MNFVRGRGSKGSHKYYASYTLIDPTLPTAHTAVAVNIFANDMKNLPEPTHIGTIMRFHRLKFQYFNNARQLYGRLTEVNPSNGKMFQGKGNTTSSLVCIRKSNYLTSVPLYFHTRAAIGLVAPSVAVSAATPAAESAVAEPSCTNTNEIQPVSSADIYAYFNLNEWLIHNPQQGLQNTFRLSDMNKLVELNLWAERLFLNMMSLNDGLVLNNSCAESLSDAFMARAQQGAHYIDAKFDVICMVACVVPPSQNSGNKVTLYVYDGSAAPTGATAAADAAGGGNGKFGCSVDQLITSSADNQSLGPRYVANTCKTMYLSMTNAALFSECRTIEDKRIVEASLDSGEHVDPHDMGDTENNAESRTIEHKLFGDLYRVVCATTEESDYITRILRLQPGMWIRIRSLHTSPECAPMTANGSLPCVGVLQKDSGVGILQPFYQDVSKIAAKYFTRQLQIQADEMMQQQQQQPVPGGRGELTGQNQPEPQPAKQVQVRTLSSSLGVDYVPLASCLASVPPAEFCCRVSIVDFYPHDISQFVRLLPATDNNPARPVFMFTIRVEDSSSQCDVVCYGEEAQFLFGGLSPEVFMQNQSVKDAVEATLLQCMDAETAAADGVDNSMDIYLWSYRSQVANKDGKHKYCTRLKAVHTALFSFDEVA